MSKKKKFLFIGGGVFVLLLIIGALSPKDKNAANENKDGEAAAATEQVESTQQSYESSAASEATNQFHYSNSKWPVGRWDRTRAVMSGTSVSGVVTVLIDENGKGSRWLPDGEVQDIVLWQLDDDNTKIFMFQVSDGTMYGYVWESENRIRLGRIQFEDGTVVTDAEFTEVYERKK